MIVVTPGQKLAYVVDTLFSQGNAARIADLAHDADIFFCESLFLDEDRDEASKRYHLTARQADTLARMANVKRLEVFHFSPRYDGMAERLYAEAAATFRVSCHWMNRCRHNASQFEEASAKNARFETAAEETRPHQGEPCICWFSWINVRPP